MYQTTELQNKYIKDIQNSEGVTYFLLRCSQIEVKYRKDFNDYN